MSMMSQYEHVMSLMTKCKIIFNTSTNYKQVDGYTLIPKNQALQMLAIPCVMQFHFFVAKTVHVMVCYVFSLFSIFMKIFEHDLFFSLVNEEVYSEVYRLLDYYFSELSPLLSSGRSV